MLFRSLLDVPCVYGVGLSICVNIAMMTAFPHMAKFIYQFL